MDIVECDSSLTIQELHVAFSLAHNAFLYLDIKHFFFCQVERSSCRFGSHKGNKVACTLALFVSSVP